MKSKQFSVFFIFCVFTVLGQQKISVEQIYNGAFRAQGMDELQSMKNTNQYTVLNVDSSSRTMQIDLYDFASLNKTATLIDTKDHTIYRGLIVIRLTGGKMILIACNSNQIFRHSLPRTIIYTLLQRN
jgi:dipeptidyl-peptidase-4